MSAHRRNALLLGILMFVSILAKANPLATGWETVAGIDLFYREGGPREAPTIVFLHGNPASSIQYVRVMEFLAKRYHVLAMDYPSFGFSTAPDRADYRYTFDNLAGTVREFLRARNVTRYVLFMQDYGVPIGFRLIAQTPDAVSAIVVQNGVIHLDGFPAAQDKNGELRRHWRTRNPLIDERRRTFTMEMKFPERKGWEWPERIPPEFVVANMIAAQRPGVIAARNDLWFDYGSNLDHYSEWQALLRQMQPPLLVLWGGRDSFFTTPGAFAYLRDVPRAEVHILDADHYATMEVPDEIADVTGQFLDRTVRSRSHLAPQGVRSNNRESH